MSSIRVKIAGYLFIAGCLLSLALLFIVVLLEFTGISHKQVIEHSKLYNKMSNERLLLVNNYYGKYLEQDPYEKFKIQKLHPYYFFSLPWRKKDIQNINNDYVNINDDGFRVNPSKGPHQGIGLLLGGSTAFGHLSSNDRETLAYHISEKNNIRIINRNAPSWNSGQELFAMTKAEPNYKLSISFSLGNDIAISCEQNNYESKVIDKPENFDKLASNFEDYIDYSQLDSKGNNILRKFKKKIKSSIPDTYLLLSLLKNEFLYSGSKTLKIEKDDYCSNISADLVASNFLKNQKVMSRLSKSIGSKHFLILQPQVSIFSKTDSSSFFTREVYDIVMASDYCRLNPCLNLNKVSLDQFDNNILLSHPYNGQALFGDNMHLLDNGVRFYSEVVSKFILSNQ